MAKDKDLKTKDKGGEVSTHVYDKADAGGGYEGTDRSDFMVPFLNLLQGNSPEVDGSDPERKLEGAEAGMFLDTQTRKLFDGEKGVILVPCLTEHCFTEWVPRDRGGGFRGSHKPDSPIVARAQVQAAGSLNLLTKDGNELAQTFIMYCLLLESLESEVPMQLIVVPFTSTKIRGYKQMMTRLRTVKDSADIPLFAHRVRILSFQDQNPQGAFKNVKLEAAVENDVGQSQMPPDHPLLAAARNFKKQIQSGLAKADHDSQASAKGGDAGDEVF